MTVWFLALILAGGPGEIEQHIVISMPNKHTCETIVELDDPPTLSRMHFPNDKSELREILERKCISGIL